MSNLSPMLAQAGAPTIGILSPFRARSLFGLVIVSATIAGFVATDPSAAHVAAGSDVDLTRLLRLMALIKAAMAAGTIGVAHWRLAWPISLLQFGIYALASAAMVTGPGLIWGMAHVGLGALLLHAGLAAMIVLIWRDPAVRSGMDAILQRRSAPWARRR